MVPRFLQSLWFMGFIGGLLIWCGFMLLIVFVVFVVFGLGMDNLWIL